MAAVPLAGRWSAKVAAGHAGRAGAVTRLLAWARAARDPGRPLLWLHAASVGEGLQALAVLDRVRARHPDWQVVFTHFSPSAEALARRVPADVADYLPWDLPDHARDLLAGLKPDALVFAKLDLWPELAVAAAAAGVRVGIIAATVSPVSGRTRWPARALLAPGYRAVTAAGAIAEPDAERLVRLGVAPERVRVLGDPRFDSARDVVAAVPTDEPLLRFGRGGTTLVAGSTWPADEQVVLEAFAEVRARRPDANLVLVPHEPTSSHLEQVERAAAAHGLPTPVRLASDPGRTPFLLVDRVGGLARLYGAGVAAYVGGGFGHAGLHSVLEPAAWGRPVVFGPFWQGSREAGLLLTRGGGVALPRGRSAAVRHLVAQWLDWLEHHAAREEAGRRALEVVQSGLGAANRCAELVEELVGRTDA